MKKQAIRMTVLVENSVKQQGLLAEHGMSFWIEKGDRRMLFDTGQGMVLQHNANTLGIALETADDVILSHGHYDHTGGLHQALASFKAAKVYAHPTVFTPRFIRCADGRGSRAIGAPFASADDLRGHVGQLIMTGKDSLQITDGVRLTGEIPRRNDYEDTGGAFYLDEACTEPDLISDDQALFLETAKGLVVLLGCAHAGVVNTLEHVRNLTGRNHIHAVLGGMHLLNAGEERLGRTIQALKEAEVQKIGLAHCTGFAAMARLFHELPNQCFPCVAGTRVDFE